MTRPLRKTLLWLTLGAFLVPSLVGTALHNVPGCQHGLSGCQHGARASGCCHGCAGDVDHSAGEHHPRPGMAAANILDGDGHSCPICNFLSSGKWIQAAAIVCSTAVAIALVMIVDRVFASRWELRPLGPRGPPSF